MPMDVDRPIFIVGPQRSGTTLLYNMLSTHSDIGYLNIAHRRMQPFPFLAHVMTRLGIPDRPMESQKIWDRFWNSEYDEMDSQSQQGPLKKHRDQNLGWLEGRHIQETLHRDL